MIYKVRAIKKKDLCNGKETFNWKLDTYNRKDYIETNCH